VWVEHEGGNGGCLVSSWEVSILGWAQWYPSSLQSSPSARNGYSLLVMDVALKPFRQCSILTDFETEAVFVRIRGWPWCWEQNGGK